MHLGARAVDTDHERTAGGACSPGAPEGDEASVQREHGCDNTCGRERRAGESERPHRDLDTIAGAWATTPLKRITELCRLTGRG
jgi:hypothetical protein